MCDFKPGDEVAKIDTRGIERKPWQINQPVSGIPVGAVFIIQSVVHHPRWGEVHGLHLVGVDCDSPHGFDHRGFRKVQKRDSSLSIEAFLTIRPGFEEPKRTPAKKRERV